MSLIEVIKNKFSPELVSEIAIKLGESEGGISKAIGILLPAVLGNLVKNSKNETILDTISRENSYKITENLLSESPDHSFLDNIKSTLFPQQPTELINLAVERSGISSDSAKTILNTVTTATVASLGEYIQNHQLENKEISKFLDEQKALIPSILPAGLSMGNLGLENLISGTVENISSVSHPLQETTISEDKNKQDIKIITSAIEPQKDEKSFWNWLLPLILLGIAAWYFWKVYEKQIPPEKIKIEEKK